MAERSPQSVAKLIVFRAFLASDGKTPATGKTIAITISKNGATSFSNPAAGATNATEMASGFYKFNLGTGDVDTLGPLTWRGAQADINDAGDIVEVVKATNAGFSALPDAAAEASGGLPTLSAAQASNGTIQANVHRWLTGTPNALSSGRVDVLVGAVTAGVIAAASFAADYFTALITAIWTTASTRILTAGTNIVLAKGTGVTGFTDLDAGGVRDAVGLASANLDTQLTDLPTLTELGLGLTVLSDRLPVALVAGRMDASVGAMATDVLTSGAVAASAVTEMQAGLATTAALATADGKLDDILLDTAEIGAAGAGLTSRASQASVTALNNLSSAQAQTAAAAALTAYDPPTRTEATSDKDEVLAAVPSASANADALLARDLGSGSGAGSLNERTVRSALRFNRNRFEIAGGVLTVYREDDVTVAFSAAITTSAGNPVSASDPV